jgi:hypothetical protein
MRRLPTLLHLLAATSAALSFMAAPATARAAWVWPVSGDVITPYRNGTDPYASGQHRGIDIAAPIGTPVVAAAGGDVRFAGTAGSSGLTITIRTGDGYDTSYLHLSSLGVRVGARVAAGERIGAVGISGTRSATAPHLHFGVRDAGTRHAYRDPLNFLPPPGGAPRPSPPTGAPAPEPRPAQPVAAPVPALRAAPHPDVALRPEARARPERAPHPLRAPHPNPSPQTVPRPRPIPRSLPGLVTEPRSVTAPHPTAAPHATPWHGTAAPHRTPWHGTAAPHATPAHSKPAPHGFPASEGALHPHNDGAHRVAASTSDPGHSRQRGLAEARGADAAAHQRSASESKQRSPLDLGWALACGGLLLAAGILGMTHEGRRTRARTRTPAPTAALRPLTGRR